MLSTGVPGQQMAILPLGGHCVRTTIHCFCPSTRSKQIWQPPEARQEPGSTGSLTTGRSRRLQVSTPQIFGQGFGNSIDPSDAGWTYVSFAVETLAAGESLTWASNGQERAFVPLSGTAEVSAAGQTWTFGGRPSVFAGLGHCLYLPRDTEVTLTAGTDLEIAIAEAPATEKFAPVLVTPDDIDIELRGGGNASRQVGSLMLPGFPLIGCTSSRS